MDTSATNNEGTSELVGPYMNDEYVKALELRLQKRDFCLVADATAQWLQQLSQLDSPLGIRLLFVAVQSHFFTSRQSELLEVLRCCHKGMNGLPPEAFILWQIIQLELGQAELCRQQTAEYLTHLSQLSVGRQTSQGEPPQPAHQPTTALEGYPELPMQADDSCTSNTRTTPVLNDASDASHGAVGLKSEGHHQFMCGTTVPDASSGARTWDAVQEHVVPVVRMYTCDILCRGVCRIEEALEYLTTAEARQLLTVEEMDMLAEEVAAAQLAAQLNSCQQRQEAQSATLQEGKALLHRYAPTAQKASTQQQSDFCTMMGHMDDEYCGPSQPEANDVHHTPQTKSTGSVGETAASQGTLNSANTRNPGSTARLSTSTPKGPLFAGLWERLKHACYQCSDGLQAVIIAVILFALYKEWKAIRMALARNVSAAGSQIRGLLGMAFALTPNPVASGRMPVAAPGRMR